MVGASFSAVIHRVFSIHPLISSKKEVGACDKWVGVSCVKSFGVLQDKSFCISLSLKLTVLYFTTGVLALLLLNEDIYSLFLTEIRCLFPKKSFRS